MSASRVRVFAPSFMGAKSSELWSRILDEYQILSKKFKVILIAEENLPEDNKNLSLLKVHKIPFEKLTTLYHMLSVAYFTIMNRKKYDLVFLRLMDHSMVGGLIALVEQLIKITNSKSTIKYFPERTFDVNTFVGDPTRTQEILGWNTKISLEKGLSMYVDLVKM